MPRRILPPFRPFPVDAATVRVGAAPCAVGATPAPRRTTVDLAPPTAPLAVDPERAAAHLFVAASQLYAHGAPCAVVASVELERAGLAALDGAPAPAVAARMARAWRIALDAME